MTKEERLREIYKEDQVMCGKDNQHIYADIIKDVFMKEIQKAGDSEMVHKLKTIRDIATKKSALIIVCLNQWQELVKMRANEIKEEKAKLAACSGDELAKWKRQAKRNRLNLLYKQMKERQADPFAFMLSK